MEHEKEEFGLVVLRAGSKVRSCMLKPWPNVCENVQHPSIRRGHHIRQFLWRCTCSKSVFPPIGKRQKTFHCYRYGEKDLQNRHE